MNEPTNDDQIPSGSTQRPTDGMPSQPPTDHPTTPADRPGDPDVARRRLVAQIAVIQAAHDDAEVFPPLGSGQPVEYIYRQGRILVRDEDLPRVQQIVPGEVAEALIFGVTAYAPADGDVQAALNLIDTQLGRGTATPDHFLWVTPAACCPATEPNKVAGAALNPPIRRDRRFLRRDSARRDVLVSVVDTGLISALTTTDPGREWLAGVTGDEEDIDTSDIGEYVGHGTFVAGVVRCVAPHAAVNVEGFLVHGGAISESAIVTQLYDAADTMPDIISMSAGCTTRDNIGLLTFETFYETRLRRVKAPVMVVAAGNDGSRQAFYPAAFDWTISVGALDGDGERADYSNFGSWVDVYALGTDVINAYPTGMYRYKEPPRSDAMEVAEFTNGLASWSGTSFATPIVAGMIAARMSITGQTARAAANSIMRIARSHARPGVGPVAEIHRLADADPAGTWSP